MFGWQFTIDELAQGDVTKHEYLWNMNVIEFLNLLSYRKSKAAWERMMIEKSKR